MGLLLPCCSCVSGSALCELGPSMSCPCRQHQPMVCSFLSALPLCIWLCHLVPWKQDGHTWPRNFRSTYQGYWDNETLQLKRFCHLDIEQFFDRFRAKRGKHLKPYLLSWYHSPSVAPRSKYDQKLQRITGLPLVISRQPRNLLNAVFVNQTLRTASGDEELAFKQRQRDLKNYQNKVGLRLPGLLRNWWFLFLPAVSYVDIECKFCKKIKFSWRFYSEIHQNIFGYPGAATRK